MIGTTAFSNTSTDYSGSIVEGYVNNYNNYLITQGVTPMETRLIYYEELENFGCDDDYWTCYANAPEWVYATSYWSMSVNNEFDVLWCVNPDNFLDYDYLEVAIAGVRPVIVISRSLIDGIGSSATKTLIEFTIFGGTTYQAEEGMTWAEWVDSEYNTDGFFISNDGKVYREDGYSVWLDDPTSGLDVISSSGNYYFMD